MIPVEITGNELIKIANFFSKIEGTTLLYSGSHYSSAKESFLFLFPIKKISISYGTDPWPVLKSQIQFNQNPYPEWVGYLTYECGAYSDEDKKIPYISTDYPISYFQKCAIVLTTKYMVVYQEEYDDPIIQDWIRKLINNPQHFLKEISKKKYHSKLKNSIESFSTYEKKIQQSKKYIIDGEFYQINLSHKIILESDIDPFQLYYQLLKLNPAPFSAYLNLKNLKIISSSPERFLKKENNLLETRPIKGTAPRDLDPIKDEKNKRDLLNSEKDKAELLMITDLMRNDLGKVSETGSVKTKKIWDLESYENVHHLLSIIESVPLSTLNPIDIIRLCFPGGSITGCPKLRAMEIIHELEKRNRGIYTGSIGFFKSNGDFDFNIAIRTVTFKKYWEFQIGGAIVSDSDPSKEYQETLDKGKSILQIFN